MLSDHLESTELFVTDARHGRTGTFNFLPETEKNDGGICISESMVCFICSHGGEAVTSSWLTAKS